jgi:MscS family membrane protein
VKLESATIRTRLIRFGDASLELEAFAYVLTDDAEDFLDIQEELLLRIMDIIEASGTAVALPSVTAPVPKNFALDARARDTVPQEK